MLSFFSCRTHIYGYRCYVIIEDLKQSRRLMLSSGPAIFNATCMTNRSQVLLPLVKVRESALRTRVREHGSMRRRTGTGMVNLNRYLPFKSDFRSYYFVIMRIGISGEFKFIHLKGFFIWLHHLGFRFDDELRKLFLK